MLQTTAGLTVFPIAGGPGVLVDSTAVPNPKASGSPGFITSSEHAIYLSGQGLSVSRLDLPTPVLAASGIKAVNAISPDGTHLLALTSLNPTLTIGFQIGESIRIHMGLPKQATQDRVVELLSKVGIPRAKERLGDYPHQFSGGMRQRVMIAIALACNPRLLLADEPTTALDVTIQAQILELIQSLSSEFGTAVVLITHDLGIAAGMCDRINVMYAGRIVETGTIDAIFETPQMPYAWGLHDSLPRLDEARGARLRTIEGMPPLLIDIPDQCRFAPRCAYARDISWEREPQLIEREGTAHVARCWGTEPGGWLK
jgi:oligopeptide transport system ATP-binding protein